MGIWAEVMELASKAISSPMCFMSVITPGYSGLKMIIVGYCQIINKSAKTDLYKIDSQCIPRNLGVPETGDSAETEKIIYLDQLGI